MNIREADQFMTDPLPDLNEKVLVTAGWLQKILREHHALNNEIGALRSAHKKHMEEISQVKHRLMISESSQPYRYIIDTKA